MLKRNINSINDELYKKYSLNIILKEELDKNVKRKKLFSDK